MNENKNLFKDILESVKKNNRKTWMFVGASVVALSLMTNTVASASQTETLTEKEVTRNVNLGDAELKDVTDVTYEVDKQNRFEAIVMYKNSTGKRFAERIGGKVEQEVDLSDLSITIVKVNEREFSLLQQHVSIFAVEKNVKMPVTKENSVNSMQAVTSLIYELGNGEAASWAYEYMNIHEALKKGITGKGVKVGVVDSGVANHSDLTVSKSEIIPDNVTNLTDMNGHGTAVAGAIAAKNNGRGAIGFAPDVTLNSYKIDDDEGGISSKSFLYALQSAMNDDVDILNASLSFSLNSPIYQAAISKAYEEGLIVVAATGNDGADNIRYPASYEDVIAVGAVKENGERDYYSNFGSTIDFVAPGRVIASTSNKGGYESKTGTSMATPHVAGLLALIMQEFPNKSSDWYYEALKDMAEDVDLKGFDVNTGYGSLAYNPEKIGNVADNEANKDVIKDVNDLPKNQQRYYSLIESYLTKLDIMPDSMRNDYLNKAENYMHHIDESLVKDKLLEILHEYNKMLDVPYSTGQTYVPKLPMTVDELSKHEQDYYRIAQKYLDEVPLATTEKRFIAAVERALEAALNIQESPIRDSLLANIHRYGGGLDIPYSNGSYYKGAIISFVNPNENVNPDEPVGTNPTPKPPTTPEEDMKGKETKVSDLPEYQQHYYILADSTIPRLTDADGYRFVHDITVWILGINSSPIRDALLERVHPYGILLNTNYSTGQRYVGPVNYEPWKKDEPVKPNPPVVEKEEKPAPIIPETPNPAPEKGEETASEIMAKSLLEKFRIYPNNQRLYNDILDVLARFGTSAREQNLKASILKELEAIRTF